MSSYLYGIVPDSHPRRLTTLHGVGKPPGELRTVRAGDLVAVVSDVEHDLRAKRRDLQAHETVLETLCEQGATLPMRFGVLADDDEMISEEVSTRAERYRELLGELGGRVEVNVKARYHEDDTVLRSVLTERDDLRALNDELRQRNGGSHEDSVRLGELVAAAVGEREERDAEALLARLREHTLRESPGPAVDRCFVNTSFLIERTQFPEFDQLVHDTADAIADLADLRIHGPLPPYSFTENGAGQ